MQNETGSHFYLTGKQESLLVFGERSLLSHCWWGDAACVVPLHSSFGDGTLISLQEPLLLLS